MAVDNLNAKVYSVWDRMAPGWTRDTQLLWDTTRVVGEDMVDRLDPQPGETILELAAGTGDTGFLAAQRVGQSGTVICSDFIPAMVEGARDRAAAAAVHNIDYRVLDAENIDLPDESVDGVLCRWGYMLMPHPDRALRETRRVLRSGGRLSFSVWGEPGHNPWATIVGTTRRDIGRPVDADPYGPGGVFSMSDPDTVRTMVRDAGFRDVDVHEVDMTWRFSNFDAIWTFLTEVAGAVAFMILELTGDERERFRARLESNVAAFKTEDGYAMPGMCLNVLAR